MKSNLLEFCQSIDFIEVVEVDDKNWVLIAENELQIHLKWSEHSHWFSCVANDEPVEEGRYEFLLQYNSLTPDINELTLGLNQDKQLVILQQVPSGIDINEAFLAFYHSILEWIVALQTNAENLTFILPSFIKA